MLGPAHIAWLRLDPDSSIFENFADPSAGQDTPHIELAFWVRVTSASDMDILLI
jgi:hypothetical protein